MVMSDGSRSSRQVEPTATREAQRKEHNSRYAPWRQLDDAAGRNMIDAKDWTTVMIKNIPNKYTQDWLAQEILATGDLCNFVHMPMSKKRPSNLGYAFANFVSAGAARNFITCFEGHTWKKHPNSQRRAQVCFARLQGLQANLEFFMERRVAHSENRPWISRCLPSGQSSTCSS